MAPETPVRGVPQPCPVQGQAVGMQRSISPPCSTVRQPEAMLLTRSSKCTGPAATPGPSASHPLPVPAGMPGAHGTAWEAVGNERALCLGAVKGACLLGAPPMLSREGPRLSKGSPCCQGLARVPLREAQGSPDGAHPGLQWAWWCPSPVPGTQPGWHGSSPNL